MAVEQPTHDKEYMGWSGTISEGYGKGTVRSLSNEPIEVLEADGDKLVFNRYPGNTAVRYILKRTGGKEWLWYNYTATTDNKKIPTTKPSYKEIAFDDVKTTNKNEVLSPKLDGAHNIIRLRPDRRIDTYSYRKSAKGKERIDHSFKTELYKIRSPKELGETTLRAELYVPGGTSSDTGAILNSNVWKARDKITSKPLSVVIHNVDTYKGKDVSGAPYREKLRILKEVNLAIPGLLMPELAYTPQEKLILLDKIKNKKHPETDEGVVSFDLNTSIPTKAKLASDYDVLITGTFPATTGTKYHGNAVGGFLARPENSNIIIRVGGGLTDQLRRDAYSNPEKYVGSWAKVKANSQLRSGKYRNPRFIEFRYEKF